MQIQRRFRLVFSSAEHDICLVEVGCPSRGGDLQFWRVLSCVEQMPGLESIQSSRLERE